MTWNLTALLQGLPLADVQRVAATCLAVATNPDPDTSERILPDSGEVERLHQLELNECISDHPEHSTASTDIAEANLSLVEDTTCALASIVESFNEYSQ